MKDMLLFTPATWDAGTGAGTCTAVVTCKLRPGGCCRLFSIDPPTARDLDDALSVEPLPGGNFRVGVHIADVAHFVRYMHDMPSCQCYLDVTQLVVAACQFMAGGWCVAGMWATTHSLYKPVTHDLHITYASPTHDYLFAHGWAHMGVLMMQQVPMSCCLS